MTDEPAARWTLLVPMKPPGSAKSRLAVTSPELRAELVLAMAGDVIEVALRCQRVGLVVVVADRPDGLEALQSMGAALVADPLGEGLNAALRHTAAVVAARDASAGIAALVADVAAVTVDQLTRTLDAAAAHPRAFLPDAAGRGTTLVTARRWDAFCPEYGPHSRRRHVAAGFTELELPDITGLRLDVDTVADLRAVAALGPGPRTRTLLAGRDGPLQ